MFPQGPWPLFGLDPPPPKQVHCRGAPALWDPHGRGGGGAWGMSLSLAAEGEAGASPGNSRAMVAMFAVGKWWLFFPRHRPIKAQRSASHLGTAAGNGALQLPGWGGRGPRRVCVLWPCVGVRGARATPRPGISGGSSVPTHRVP